MGKKVYVGNISFKTTEEGLRSFFEEGGREVVSCRIILDRETGRSRGFGFVEFSAEEEAQSVIQNLNGAELDGRELKINEARERSR